MGGDLTDFDHGVLLHIAQDTDLVTIDAWVNGTKVVSHTVRPNAVGTTSLNALAQALRAANLSTSAVQGAIVWSPQPSKQEVGQLKRIVSFFWGIVRAFLP